MVQVLIYIGLALIPLVILKGYDGRYTKEVVEISIVSAVALYSVFTGSLKPIRNASLLILVFCMLLFTLFVPPSGLAVGIMQNESFVISNRIDIDNLWNFKAIAYGWIYLLFLASIISVKLEIKRVFQIISYSGLFAAVIGILQKLGFYQFMYPKTGQEFRWVTNGDVFSFLGQPTILAAYLSLCIVPSLAIRNYWITAVILLCVLITGSSFGILASCAAIAMYILKRNKYLFLSSFLIILCIALIFLFVIKTPSNARFEIWNLLIKDIINPLGPNGPRYSLTGFGAGAFHYIFPLKYQMPWGQAHNEFLEMLFNTGAIGFILFCSAIVTFLLDCWKCFYGKFESENIRILTIMFLTACILAMGTFVWQLAFGRFYTVVTLGLIYGLIQKESLKCHTEI